MGWMMKAANLNYELARAVDSAARDEIVLYTAIRAIAEGAEPTEEFARAAVILAGQLRRARRVALDLAALSNQSMKVAMPALNGRTDTEESK